MAKSAAKTGPGPTTLVAIEQYFPIKERIIEDNLAAQILPSGRAFLHLAKFRSFRDWIVRATDKNSPGMWCCMLCRKRYIDEKVTESKSQTEAVVNLGAGFDTRAYRLPALAAIPVWEIDQPENVKAKKLRLKKVFGTIPSHVNLIAMDFDHEDVRTVLKAHGYALNKRTFFIWEAVTQYLTEEGIRSTFSFLSNAAQGSRLAFTYVQKDFLEGKSVYGWEKLYKKFVLDDKTWIFGMEPKTWPEFLKEYGWRVIEDVGYDEMAEKYVKPTGRALDTTPIERMVYAEKV